MIDRNNVSINIKKPAQEIINSKIKPGSIVLWLLMMVPMAIQN